MSANTCHFVLAEKKHCYSVFSLLLPVMLVLVSVVAGGDPVLFPVMDLSEAHHTVIQYHSIASVQGETCIGVTLWGG